MLASVMLKMGTYGLIAMPADVSQRGTALGGLDCHPGDRRII